MKTINIADVDDENNDFGIMRPTHIIHVSPQALSENHINLKEYADDLDEYQAAFLLVEDVPVIIHRYMSSEENNFTIYVDTDKASGKNENVFSIPEKLIDALHIDKLSGLKWVNEELRESHSFRTRPVIKEKEKITLKNSQFLTIKKNGLEIKKSGIQARLTHILGMLEMERNGVQRPLSMKEQRMLRARLKRKNSPQTRNIAKKSRA